MTERKYPYELFGIECGKGWEKLYQPLIDLCGLYGAQIGQVKEKFGTLRFYTLGCPAEHSDKLGAAITAMENASAHTCEDCGEDSRTYDHEKQEHVYKAKTKGNGWIRTLCDPCRETWERAIEERKKPKT